MRLAVIPARGGSKRIPRKNIKPFGGRPMIAWSINAAFKSNLFDRVIVSTDDEEIADVARNFGADVPFLRPAELSDDYTATAPVIAHAINWERANRASSPDFTCCIYATAPFLDPDDIRRGLDLLMKGDAEFSFAVTTFGAPIQRAIRVKDDGRVEMFDPLKFNVRSQDLEQAWHDAGQFYWGRSDAWMSSKPLFGSHSVALPIPRHRVQDIDTLEDWERAELILRTMAAT